MTNMILREREKKRIEKEQRKEYISQNFQSLRKKFPEQSATAICMQLASEIGISLQAVRDCVKKMDLWFYSK